MVTRAVYQYRPKSMQSLYALIEHALQEESWRQYMASVAWSIGRMQTKTYPISPYEKPDFSRKKADTRSGYEIMTDILGKLGGNT